MSSTLTQVAKILRNSLKTDDRTKAQKFSVRQHDGEIHVEWQQDIGLDAIINASAKMVALRQEFHLPVPTTNSADSSIIDVVLHQTMSKNDLHGRVYMLCAGRYQGRVIAR